MILNYDEYFLYDFFFIGLFKASFNFLCKLNIFYFKSCYSLVNKFLKKISLNFPAIFLKPQIIFFSSGRIWRCRWGLVVWLQQPRRLSRKPKLGRIQSMKSKSFSCISLTYLFLEFRNSQHVSALFFLYKKVFFSSFFSVNEIAVHIFC